MDGSKPQRQLTSLTQPRALGLGDILTSSGRIRILTLLSKVGELHLTEIAKRTGQSYSSTERHLEDLARASVVEEHDYARVRIFKLKIDIPKVKMLREVILAWDPGSTESILGQAQA
jgi:DNA-binding transcriptional ArsR family regulator